MIELRNVSFSYGELEILKDFNLHVLDGDCVCLWGESGSGKTTITRLILGLEKEFNGKINSPNKISCVFQEDRLIESSNVINNIRMVLNSEQYEIADKLLDETGFYGIRKKRISSLSGGMKRRVSIIRAIAFGGDALILDEAFNGIDYENKIVLANIIKREFLAKNKSVIMITHNKEDAKLLGARIIKIKSDEI